MNKFKQILLTALTVISVSISAQVPIDVDVTSRRIDNGQLYLIDQLSVKDQLSFSVVIPQTNLNDVEKDWLKYVGKKSRGKSVVQDGAHLQYGATNKNISSERFEVYSKLLEASDGVHLTVWLMQNNTVFVSENPGSGLDLAVQKYVRDFAILEYRNAVQLELKTEERKLKGLEQEYAQLVKEQEKSTKKINENDRSKVRSADVIATNNRDIESTSYQIYDQKEMVEQTASDPNAQSGAEKTLDGLKAEKKDLQKDNVQQGRNVDEWNKENREEERNITTNIQKIVWKTEDLEKQRQKVREVKTKLENIG